MNQLSTSPQTNPIEATLFLTNKCNFRCEGCKRQIEGVNVYKEMTVETVKRLLTVYPLLRGVCLAGLGEPTLCSHFGDIVNYLINSGKYVGVVSNGSNVESLIGLKSHPNYVSISLYGYDRDSYEKAVKLDVFDLVVNNFSLMRRHLSNIGFSYFINKKNYKDLKEIIHIARESGADFLHITNYLAYDISEKEEVEKIITVNDKDIIAEIDCLLSCLNLPGARPVYVDIDNFIFNCPSYRTLINVNGAGDLSACQRQISPSSEFGNIFDDKDWYNEGLIQECRAKIRSGQYPHENCKYCFGKMGSSQGSNLSIAIFILFHEKVDQTIESINSFLPFGIPIYILNNGSSQQSTTRLLVHIQDFKNVIMFDAEQNLGVGVGRNYLIEHTKEEWLFFVDNDITIQSTNLVENLISHISQNQEIEAFIPTLYNIHENSFVNFLKILLDNNRVIFKELLDEYTNYFPGGAAVVNRKVFQRCGLYDKKMFIGLEDMELALRSIFTDEPIRCKVVKDIILHHNHKTVTANDDKRAVITRYDMGIQEKSYLRIVEKYPNLKFDHSYQSWVVEQQTKMTRSKEIDLTVLTPLKNFGATTVPRFLVNIFDYSIESSFIEELSDIVLEWYPSSKSVQFVNCGKYAKEIQNKFSSVFFFDSISAQETNMSSFLDPESYASLEEWECKVLNNCGTHVIAMNILERLRDPRPFLHSLRNLLLSGCECVLVIDCQDTLDGQVTHGAYWRQWKYSEVHQLLTSSGFSISRFEQTCNAAGYFIVEIQCSRLDYELFLNSLYIPPPSMEYLVVSQEHSDAAVTGGIGTYVGELEKIISPDALGIMLIGSGELLPDLYRCKQNKNFYLSLFLGESLLDVRLEDAVTLVLDALVYIYYNLKVIEFQDVNGKGFRFIQGKHAGFYPTKLTTQVVCHASRISLEKIFKLWIDPNDKELFEEKYVIENADIIKFPTKYIADFYKSVGYSSKNKVERYERLPFNYNTSFDHKHNYADLDTLIFFGKRNSYKGFDLFTNVVRKLVSSSCRLRRIMLIGPQCDEMIEYNSYYDEIAGDGIIVEEYSLKRDDALKLLVTNANRSLCVIPYLADNHPYSVLEVISSYCPFVATNTGGIPELIPVKYTQDVLSNPTTECLIDCIERWWLRTPADRRMFTKNLCDDAIKDQSLINENLYNDLMKVYSEWHERNKAQTSISVNSSVTCLVILDNYDEILSFINMLRQQTKSPESVIFLKRASCLPKEVLDVSEILESINYPKYQVIYFDCDTDGDLLNEGLRVVTTQYVSTFSTSVIISNSCIGAYLRYMELDPDCAYVTSYTGIYSDLGDNNRPPEKVESYLGEGIFISQVNNLLGHPYGLFRTESIRQCGGFVRSDEIIRCGWSTIMRLVSKGYKIGVIPRPEICILSKNKTYGNCYSDQYHLAIETHGVDRFGCFRLQAIARWLSLQTNGNITSQITNAKLIEENKIQLNYIHELEKSICSYTNSLSWKLTRPLRLAKKIIKKVIK